MKLVTFRIGAETYGIELSQVKEIIMPVDPVPVPGMVEPVQGVLNLRGEIVPIVKIEAILHPRGVGSPSSARARRIIILDPPEGTFAFIADSVTEVATIPREELQPAPTIGGQDAPHGAVVGIARVPGRMVVCIDPSRLILDRTHIKEIAESGVGV
jgi:purine-binding chemotaxis protein CheW